VHPLKIASEEKPVPHLDRWIIGIMVAIVSVFGLYLASQARDDVMYVTGILIFIVGVRFNFFQIKKVVGAKQPE
jgi:uncharacterized membrane protein